MVIGERWTLLIVRDAFYGVRRFNDFHAHLDVPKAVLSARLSGLLAEGILARSPDPAHAGRHLYELTSAGRDLWPVVHALLAWGNLHRYPSGRVFKHVSCATELAEDGHCPTCGETPLAGDILTEPRRDRTGLRDDPVAIALRQPHRLLEPIETHQQSPSPR